MKSLLNKWTLLVLALALTGGAYSLWRARTATPPVERYKLVALTEGPLIRNVSANGTLNPVVLVNVGTQVSGTVKKLFADYNQQVKAGQVLLELDPSLLQAQIAQSTAGLVRAQAALKLAQSNARRAHDLLRQEYVSRQDAEQAEDGVAGARAQLEVARAQLARDRTNLSYTVIRSPVSGTVIDRSVDVGQTVAASFQTPTLFKIGQDLSRMQIDTTVAEADVGGIKVGQPVYFTVDAFPDRDFAGTVRQIRLNPTTQQNVVTYNVVVAVDNADLKLLPGMTAYVNIEVERRDHALLVSNAALRFKPADGDDDGKAGQPRRRSGIGSTVHVLRQGKPAAVKIRTGLSDNRQSEVLDSAGLKAGDQVIVADREAAGKDKAKQSSRLF